MSDLTSLEPVVLDRITGALAVAVAAAAAVGGFWMRGSTAVPAAAWAVLAATVVAIVEFLAAAGGLREPAAAASARLVIAAFAVCPAMSLLGAKRPQHGVWQVIVAALAVVIAMPAVSAVVIRPGSLPDVHLLVRGFLLVLAIAGWVNFLGTRRLAEATLVTLGLVLFLRPFLPGVDTSATIVSPWADLASAAAVASGAIVAVLRRPAVAVDHAGGFDAIERPFAALRDSIGAAWSMRIAERFNAIADSRGWPCRLSLAGFSAGGDADDRAWRPQARGVFESLMRRFVSREWLQRHGGDTVPSAGTLPREEVE